VTDINHRRSKRHQSYLRELTVQIIRVSLRSYGGHPLLDIRTWWTGDDGAVQHPGKGFSCLKDLPRLAQAVTEALKRARMLGLVGDESEGSE